MKVTLSQSNVLVTLDNEQDAITVDSCLKKLTVEQLVEHIVHFPLLKEKVAALEKKELAALEVKPNKPVVTKKVGAGAKKHKK